MLHQSESVLREQATTAAKTMAKKKSRKYVALGTAAAIVATGGAAWAAVAIFGFGSLDAGPAQPNNLNVSGVQLSNSLVPGATVGATGWVGNPNDFPVTVTGIVVRDGSIAVTGAGCSLGSLTIGGSAATYPGPEGGAGHKFDVSTAVELLPGETKQVSVDDVVSQPASGTALCGVKADFAVVSKVGS